MIFKNTPTVFVFLQKTRLLQNYEYIIVIELNFRTFKTKGLNRVLKFLYNFISMCNFPSRIHNCNQWLDSRQKAPESETNILDLKIFFFSFNRELTVKERERERAREEILLLRSAKNPRDRFFFPRYSVAAAAEEFLKLEKNPFIASGGMIKPSFPQEGKCFSRVSRLVDRFAARLRKR